MDDQLSKCGQRHLRLTEIICSKIAFNVRSPAFTSFTPFIKCTFLDIFVSHYRGKFMRVFWQTVFCVLVACSCSAEDARFFDYRYALVRELSSSFDDSLKQHPPSHPIDLALAEQQHENYVRVLEGLVPEVVRLKGDPNHPDCNFIEDTAIIVGGAAVISRMGAPERRGEEVAIAQALKELGVETISLQAPATMDGGDILYTGKHLFVGLSRRTNQEAVKQLQEIFEGKLEVVGIPVIEGLHLKSVISLFDQETLVVAGDLAGGEVRKNIENAAPSEYRFVVVPDVPASNVLRVNSSLLVQENFPASEKILQALCEEKQISMIKLNMSELIKADGALTCGSLLFNKDL